MKIIKKGINPEDLLFLIICYNCQSELEYDKKDINTDCRNDSYVICPVCKSYLTHDYKKKGT